MNPNKFRKVEKIKLLLTKLEEENGVIINGNK